MSDVFALLVETELRSARHHHSQLRSAHEAWAVIFEELEELRAEVFKKREQRYKKAMLKELVQVAAMCQRMAEDLDLVDIGNRADALETQFHESLRRLAFEEVKAGDA